MPRTPINNTEYNNYIKFMLFLNSNRGYCSAIDPEYFDFVSSIKVFPENLARTVLLATPIFKQRGIYILHRQGKDSKIKGGEFWLTHNGMDIVRNEAREHFPAFLQEPIPTPNQEEEQQPTALDIVRQAKIEYDRKRKEEQEKRWTKEEVVHLLTNEAHMVGRMLGTGYDLLEPIHSEWIKTWVLNPQGFRVTVHQAHRDSFKSTCLRLCIAILLVLNPLLTIILLRKSEDAVKELVNGVSKILDTPLFQTFINILHPDIVKKGGFKKTTDTALSIDTNLNTSLSGEFQLRGLGLGSPLTGKHAALIITDDIVTTDDRESEAERRSTIAKYQELMNILSNNKGFSDTRILNIGTPWHEEDAFALMERGLKEKSDRQKELEEIDLRNLSPKEIKAIKREIRQLNMLRGLFVYNCYQTGLMTKEDIEWKKRVLNDDALFQANYMLSLVSDAEKPFPKIKNVGNYSKAFYQNAWEVFAAIDAAYSGDDRTAVGIGACNWETNEVIVYGRMYKTALDKNYMEVAEVLFECGVSKIFMETNTDKGLMGDKFRELGFVVDSYHESMNKHTKIVSTIRPYWREEGQELLPAVQFVEETDEEYLKEVWGYKKGVKHDDAPDNLACLLLKGKFGSLAVRVS